MPTVVVTSFWPSPMIVIVELEDEADTLAPLEIDTSATVPAMGATRVAADRFCCITVSSAAAASMLF